jgi:glycosyltransferase involved in cell wall biosynthesis
MSFNPEDSEPAFSILIPSWNNLPYLKKCIESIRKHSIYRHEIIIHINEGKDGSAEWIKQQAGLKLSFSETNIGVCYALNKCRSLATTNYILYMNDDMYVCPGWDAYLADEIKAIGHNYFFLSATAIEPKAQSKCSIEKNYGTTIETFNEDLLLQEYSQLPMNDWSGATWPPNVVHKDVWDLVGGYSIEFSPGMYSDPDFSMKLWKAGIRLFKGVSKSRVYHFGSVSIKRVVNNKGYNQFIAKWGFTSSVLTNHLLKRGEPFTGPLPDAAIPLKLRFKNFFKRMGTSVIRSHE